MIKMIHDSIKYKFYFVSASSLGMLKLNETKNHSSFFDICWGSGCLHWVGKEGEVSACAQAFLHHSTEEWQLESAYSLLSGFFFLQHTSLSPDGKLLVIVGDNPDGILVDAATGKVIYF